MTSILTLRLLCPLCRIEIARLERRVLGPSATPEAASPYLCAICAAHGTTTAQEARCDLH